MKTRAAVIDSLEGDFRFATIELDEPRPDEVVVRLEACGICHTDVSARHYMALPAVLGHEGTGTVVQCGSAVTDVQVGDSVIMSYGWCGACPDCASGHAYACERSVEGSIGGRRFDGSTTLSMAGGPLTGAFFQQSSFAHHALVPARNVTVDRVGLDPALRAALPCGVMTGAGAVLNSLQLQQGESLVVFGAGAVGLAAVMAAQLAGAATVVVVDVHEGRLALAETLGATHAIHAGQGDVLAALKKISPRGFAASLETSSQESALQAAIECLAMRGRCGLVTIPRNGEPFPFTPFPLLVKSARVQGILLGSALPREFLPQLVSYHQQGLFPFDRLIKTYPFAAINQAFADAKSGEVIKPVLLMP
jgi:aryl-alcohol dehydrogenase